MAGPTQTDLPVTPGSGTNVSGYTNGNSYFAQAIGYDSNPAVNNSAWTSSTTLNTTLSTNTAGYATTIVTYTLSGTVTAGVVTFQGYDGTNWWTIPAPRVNAFYVDQGTYSLANGSMAWAINSGGWQQIRVNLTTVITSTGTATFQLLVQAGSNSLVSNVGWMQQLDSTNDAISSWEKGVTYTKLTATGVVVSGTCVFYGYTCEASTAGTAIFYDNTTNSGNTILGAAAATLVAGTNVLLSKGITMTTGLYFVLGGTSATLNVLTRNISK